MPYLSTGPCFSTGPKSSSGLLSNGNRSPNVRSPRRSARRGFSLLGLAAIVAVLALVVPLTAWWLKPSLFHSQEDSSVLTDRVKLDAFTYDVVERGEIESSSNIEVRCEVQSRGGGGGSMGGGGGTSIIEIVPEGTIVQPGDFLVKLDDSSLQSERTQQLIVVSSSQATVIQSTATVKTAQIAKREYEEGTFKQDEELLNSEVFVAEENLRRAEEYARYSEKLSARGYITPPQLEADRFAVKKAGADLSVAKTKLTVLRDFTKAKMVNQFDADIKVAEAKLKSDEKTHELDKSKLELIETQIAKCMIKAPSGGQVVYANESGGRNGNDIIIQEGTAVRERQVIIRLPDPQKMQVKAKINESRVDFVHEGLPVKIRLDALPGVDLLGTIKRVNDYPIANGNWFGSSAKEYGTFVEIHNPPKSMRPGMTAEVSIRVEQLENALLLPVQAVFERAGKQFCLLPTESGDLEPREVKIGSANDRFVVIREGLAKDDEVVSNPRKYLNQVDLPADTNPQRTEMLAGVPAPGDRGKMAAKAEKTDTKLASADGKLASADGKMAAADGKQRRGGGASGGGGKSGKGGGPGGGPGAGKMDPGAIANMMMQRMDKNSDGKLDANELADLSEQQRTGLQAGDTNSDGVVDGKELAAVMIKFRGAGGGGGRPPQNAGGGGARP